MIRLPMQLGIELAAAAILESWWTHREEKRHDARLDGYAKRIAVILALTSDKTTIDLDIVEPVLALAERQSMLRAEFFPQDAKSIVEKFELQIADRLAKSGSMFKRDLVRATNVHRPGSGGAANFNRALQEQPAGTVPVASRNQRGTKSTPWLKTERRQFASGPGEDGRRSAR